MAGAEQAAWQSVRGIPPPAPPQVNPDFCFVSTHHDKELDPARPFADTPRGATERIQTTPRRHMSAVLEPMGQSNGIAGWLDKERTIAGRASTAGWCRKPARKTAIHLCIGMAYGFSVFWLPLSRALGVTAAQACPKTCRCGPNCSPPPATGASPAWAGCTPCSSCCWAARRRCGAAGSSAPGRARPVWCRPCAGAAAW